MHNSAGPGGEAPSEMPGCNTVSQALATLEQARLRGTPVALVRVGLGDRAPNDADCVSLARRLRAGVRANDPVCWLGADGYAILLLGAEPNRGSPRGDPPDPDPGSTMCGAGGHARRATRRRPAAAVRPFPGDAAYAARHSRLIERHHLPHVVPTAQLLSLSR